MLLCDSACKRVGQTIAGLKYQMYAYMYVYTHAYVIFSTYFIVVSG